MHHQCLIPKLPVESNKIRVTGYFLWVEVALSQYSEYSEHEEGNIIDASQVCPKDFNMASVRL